jgi:hypothetical protein
MKFPTTKLGILFLTTAVTLGVMPGLTAPSYAAEGDTLSTVTCVSGTVGIAFDGTAIVIPEGTQFTRCLPDGTNLGATPITGTTDIIDAMTFDKTRGLFWGATNDQGAGSRNVYQITTLGVATFMFSATADGFVFTDGFDYDGEDDSLWISGDVAPNIWHYDTDGTLIAGPIPIPLDPSNSCGNSGIAAGEGILYLAFNGCNIIQKHDKSDLSLISAFTLETGRAEDLACDDVTFAANGTDAIWTKDAFDPEVVAFEVPAGTCPVGGGGEPPEPIVGGELLSLDSSALFMAGAFANAFWIVPTALGLGLAAALTAIRMKRRN